MNYYIVDRYGKKIIPEQGSPSNVNVDNILLDLKLTNTLNRFKEFVYIDGELTTLNIWDSPDKETQYYEVLYNYTDGNLTEIITTRISDSFTYSKVLDYSLEGNLTSINITT